MSDHLRDRVVAAVGDHYLIEGELGRGGMAVVFRAVDKRLNRRVAIKVLPPEHAFNEKVRARFLREAQMAARLTHPSIVPIFSVHEREGMVYFVMALVDGHSVAALLAMHGTIAPADVRTIVADVADALDFAHRQGVVHRDIKPDNILIDHRSRRAMVTDFGIARAAAEDQRLTVAGMAVGTPAYMSPEQAMGEREIDGRSDIYSLGIVAYQMLAGETPFKATNTPSMLMKHVSEPPPPLRPRRPDAPDDLVRAVERCLGKRPEDRWRSGAELRDNVIGRPGGEYHAPPPPADAQPRAVAPGPFAHQMMPAAHAAPGTPVASAAPPQPQFAPWMLEPPPGLSRWERRAWNRDRRQMMRDAVRMGYKIPEMSVDEKVSRFRRSLVRYGAASLMLFAINAMMGGFPWFIFPALGMMVGLANQLGSLWSDGVPLRRLFFGGTRPGEAPVRVVPPPALMMPPPEVAIAHVPPEIIEGAHGPAIRRAAASRHVVVEILGRMTKKEREMLPGDVEQTIQALLDRVIAVGTTLHRLDADANGSSLGSLDERLARLKREPESSERDRRLALLERQRATLADLVSRRTTLITQFESATVALENLKLDLVRFRSAGVSSALEDVSSATREARAVSRDIGHMLDAADEVRRI